MTQIMNLATAIAIGIGLTPMVVYRRNHNYKSGLFIANAVCIVLNMSILTYNLWYP